MDGKTFETDVRELARILWGARPGDGAPQIIDGQERDCIFRLNDEFYYYIECTIDRSLKKVRHDSFKMTNYREKLSKKGIFIKLFFITFEEPTADQFSYCNNLNIDCLSFNEFKKKLINANEYILLRKKYRFGSAINPKSDSDNVDDLYYQPVKIHNDTDNTKIKIDDIPDLLTNNDVIILEGDYGMGKSLNLKILFDNLSNKYLNSKGLSKIPIVLNLRDHWEQRDIDEALLRHSSRIGFSSPNDLIKAFNGGRLIVILDGFDEITSAPWANANEDQLKDLRKRASALIRKFISDSKGKSPVLVAGRIHYFDSRKELLTAFNITLNHNYKFLRLTEFSDEEAKEFIKQNGYDGNLPSWFPKRPLLVASILSKYSIENITSDPMTLSPAMAWDGLINLICQRESKIQHEILSAAEIRKILEEIATNTRNSIKRLGPVEEILIYESYNTVVGSSPDNTARPLLHRLPGLSVRSQDNGERYFLDDQMLDVLRGEAVYQFAINPNQSIKSAENWKQGISGYAIDFVIEKLLLVYSDNKIKGILITALEKAAISLGYSTLALDLFIILLEYLPEGSEVSLKNIKINDGSCRKLDLDKSITITNGELEECTIDELYTTHESDIINFKLTNCLIDNLYGVSNFNQIPNYLIFDDKSYVENYFSTDSNSGILSNSQIENNHKLLIVLLKKIYSTRSGAKMESALFRGIDSKFIPQNKKNINFTIK